MSQFQDIHPCNRLTKEHIKKTMNEMGNRLAIEVTYWIHLVTILIQSNVIGKNVTH